MGSISIAPKHQQCYQNVVVMRHGDRIDDHVESWLLNAARPWDPPLIDAGLVRAFRSGVKLRTQLGFPIHRVFVSPFMRCVETASQVVHALCDVCDDNLDSDSGIDQLIDPPKIKVSIEYGLCEILNSEAIKKHPEDGDWGFNLLELQKKFPAGTVDPEPEPVVERLPIWEEGTSDGKARFGRVIHTLADKYPSDNILLITHGKGLRAAVSSFVNVMREENVGYCAYVQLQREITWINDSSYSAGKANIVSHHGCFLKDGCHQFAQT